MFPLSAAQERLWYTHSLNGRGDQYNIPLTLDIRGRLNVPALCHAFQRVVSRHDTMRAAFLERNNRPVQHIRATDNLVAWLRIADLRRLASEAQGLMTRLQYAESATAFVLADAPLLRVSLLLLEDDRHVLLVSMHHIVSDGASLRILLSEIASAYEHYAGGTLDGLTPLKYQYADYASWESRYLASADAARSAEFWREYLRDAPVNAGFPADYRPGSQEQYFGKESRLALGADLCRRLRLHARRAQCSEFMVMLGALAAVMQRYTGHRDLVIATPTEGRHLPEWSALIGFFVNMLPIRISVRRGATFDELVQATRHAALQALEHAKYPFLNMLKDSRLNRSVDETPYCDVIFQKVDVLRSALANALPAWSDISVPCNTAKFDLTLNAVDAGLSIDLVCEYNAQLYCAQRIDGFLRHYANFLEAALLRPDADIAMHRILDEAEHRQIVTVWNRTTSAFPATDVYSLVEAQARGTPDRTALVQDDRHLSYTELIAQVAALAQRLSVSRDDSEFIGVLLERSVQFVIAVLAITRLGRAYVPIDVSQPKDRIDYILRDAGITMLVTSEGLANRFQIGTADVATIRIDAPDTSLCTPATRVAAAAGADASSNLRRQVGYRANAYCLYTSGSTGTPKGVIVSQAALCNYLWYARRCYGLDASTMALHSSLSADLTVTSLLGPLIAGGTIRIYAQGQDLLRQIVAEDAVDVLKVTPAHLAQLDHDVPRAKRLRALIVGGERLTPSLAARARKIFGSGLALYNEYGPTEATVGCVVYEYRGDEWGVDSIPIGRPIANMEAYVLDEQFDPVPRGVKGEIYLAGLGLAAGYCNARELSAEKFLPNPFRSGQRMYRTGDVGVLHFSGEMEFSHRNDRQVKVRGYRVELREIEAVLAQHEAIRSCVVEVRGAAAHRSRSALESHADEPQRIVGYYVATTALSPTLLRKHLGKKLPEYMIPSVFVPMDAMPLTSSGKLDRARLPAVDRARPQLQVQYVPPGNQVEADLVAIWSKLLYMDEVGVGDDFFELGGHSLLAFELIGAIVAGFDVDIDMNTLIGNSTIAALARLIEDAKGTPSSQRLRQIEPDIANAHEPFPLTETQEAYWVGRTGAFDMGNVANHGYLEVTCRELHIHRLEQAWAKLVRRHGMLRAIVQTDATQRILPEVHCEPCPIIDLRAIPADCVAAVVERMRETLSHEIRPLDRWPLFDIRIVLKSAHEACLLLSLEVMHVDESSFLILSDELGQLYLRPDTVTASLEISFRDYVLGQQRLPSELKEKSWQYWSQILEDLPPGPELPAAVARKEVDTPQFTRRAFSMDADRWNAVQKLARSIKVTPSGLLLAAYAEVLARWSNSRKFTLTIPVYNRLPLHPQINHVLGVFTAINLLVVDIPPRSSFVSRAVNIQQRLWRDLDHRFVNGVTLHREIGRRRGASSEATFPYVFTNIIGLGRSGKSTGIKSIGTITYGLSQTPQVLLDCQLSEEAGGLYACWDCVDPAFPAGMMDEMFQAFERVVHALSCDPAQLDALIEAALFPSQCREQRALVNDTQGPVRETTVPAEFVAQLAHNAANIALVDAEREVSHGQLHEMACAVAACLREHGVGPDQLVGVCVEKGWRQIVGVFGVLFAGAAYLPIDPALPRDRIDLYLRHARVNLLLTQSHLLDALSGMTVQPIALDRLLDAPLATQALLPACCEPAHLCYMLYTSGSTGEPKGVMIEHRSVVNRMADIAQRFALGRADRAIAITSLQHDLSVFDMFGPLLVGAGLVIPDRQRMLDPAHWVQLIADCRVTLWNSVPAFMDILVSYLETQPGVKLGGLRLILLSGDRIPPKLYFRIKNVLPDAEVVSLGGPTEITVWDICYPLPHLASDAKRIPYGYPLQNSQCHILDDELRDCPTWVTGELYSSGIGLARGYWDDAQLTQHAFIAHPQTGVRLYRTGDLGRYLPAGCIDIVGRKDFQVKVNGYRVECEEIEALLGRHPRVARAAVSTSPHAAGGQGLVAYVVPSDSGAVAPTPDAAGKKLEHLQFRLSQPGIRRFGDDSETIRLREAQKPDPEQVELYLSRRSFRRFRPGPIARADMAVVLDSLAQIRIDAAPFPKYRYGSAGNLYPVQTYIYVRPEGVSGLRGGVYYHNPIDRSLVLTGALEAFPADAVGMENRRILADASFIVFLIADLDAIRPVYGETALRYCAIEAGLMAQLLETSCVGTQIGLTQIGGIQIDTVRDCFQLGIAHELMHALLGGTVERGSDALASYMKDIADSAGTSMPTADLSAELQRYLQSKLSRAIVPQRFIVLDSLPLNANGKVDRDALPLPQSVQSSSAAAYLEPQNALQHSLVEIWRQVLDVQRVGIHDNFFDLGGNSLLLIKANQQIAARLHAEVSITDMFSYPTVDLLAQFLQARGRPHETPVVESARLQRRKERRRH